MHVGTPSGQPTYPSIVVRRRVEWPDTDAAGHFHQSAVMRWVEYAETVLLDRLGMTHLIGRMPRARYEADYRSVLWFNQLVDVELSVTALGRTSITYAFTVRASDNVAALGVMVAVNCDPQVGVPDPWPDHVRSALSEAGPLRPETWAV